MPHFRRLLIALDHLDEVITIIRSSQTDAEAQAELMARFELTERQSQAILDMRLRRLTGLERDKIQNEYNDLLALIADLADILAKPERVNCYTSRKNWTKASVNSQMLVVQSLWSEKSFLLRMKISSKKKMLLSLFQIRVY